ncbi:camk camkl chk1 protein kinase [Malassezia pachydermatis]|uniref:non-specific serine/threonine protein kinase n=1 Tax=Malassezia pachydermatis TaxID=77020 RepID=A0A0M9VMQ3_9BASI|nr:camk camkl chk1 protein kinase [Malassezia pachydermatis]KOS12473.1 camk camkl chk1 protein kinase [Malassezia pachydermatis]
MYPTVLGYQIVQLLGGGGFSRVFRAVNPSSSAHPQAAVKVVSYVSTSNKQPIDRRALQKEVQIHSILKHKNVLAFLGSVEYAVGSSAPSNYVRGLYILLELCAGGDLFDKIAPDVGVDEDLAHFYFTQLMAGLVYIHGQGVTHRDIKPENMLLDAQGNLKIADFGLCSVYKYKGKERTLHGTCGSLPYIAPEMNGRPYQGEPVDVWSSGVVLFAMLVGNTPWDEPTRRSPEYTAYLSGELFRVDPWTRLSGDTLSLLRKMMHPDPAKRITLAQIQRHRWFTRPNSLLTSGKCNDPVSLAERLLYGLMVSGDMHVSLHSDGQRAPVPENISLTQPDALASRSSLAWGADDTMPSSTAQPALGARRRLMTTSQVPGRTRDLSTQSDDMGGEFTQALGYFTQSSAAPMGMVLQLTRFYTAADPASMAHILSQALHKQKAQFHVDAMGDDPDWMDDVEDVEATSTASSSGPDTLRHAHGVRIRLGLMDRRKCALKGEIRMERVAELPSDLGDAAGKPGSFVLMRRSKGNPLEWRRLFRDLCRDPDVRTNIAMPSSM